MCILRDSRVFMLDTFVRLCYLKMNFFQQLYNSRIFHVMVNIMCLCYRTGQKTLLSFKIKILELLELSRCVGQFESCFFAYTLYKLGRENAIKRRTKVYLVYSISSRSPNSLAIVIRFKDFVFQKLNSIFKLLDESKIMSAIS